MPFEDGTRGQWALLELRWKASVLERIGIMQTKRCMSYTFAHQQDPFNLILIAVIFLPTLLKCLLQNLACEPYFTNVVFDIVSDTITITCESTVLSVQPACFCTSPVRTGRFESFLLSLSTHSFKCCKPTCSSYINEARNTFNHI